jgi:hypothetical protein
VAANPHVLGGEEKLCPIFTSGKGKKRVFGESVWTREGLEYFYTTEKHWKMVYTTKSIFSKFATEWEHWEPEDKTLKNTIRTHWLHDEEIYEIKKKRAKKGGEEKEWWDKDGEDGYTSAHNHVDWEWDDTVMRKDEGILDNNNDSKSGGDENQSDGNKEEGYGGKGEGGDDDEKKESGTKKGINGNEKKRKIPSRTSGRGRK